MNFRNITLTPEEDAERKKYIELVRARTLAAEKPLYAFVQTFGCQQNEADSEKIRGYLAMMGYGFTA